MCEAVQHAHMKGLIHRDLKPSNILVTPIGEQSGESAAPMRGMLVKVIDFGVAKAISHTLTEKTIFTERGQIIGTPEYMSPEQAEMGATDIDTRADVYSLGVVLYELLSGTLPFDSKMLRRAGYSEIHRIIREVEPPKPSTQVNSAEGELARSISVARQADRGKIARELMRELEWIPLKALRKDRTRRYTSAEALRADVRRYLDGRPLEAAPESRWYLARKIMRRNRLQFGAAAVVVLTLTTGVVGTSLALSRAVRAEKQERTRAGELEQVSAFQEEMLRQIDSTLAGVQLVADIRKQFAASIAEDDELSAEERADHIDRFNAYVAHINGTDSATRLIDRSILAPAMKATDEKFKDQPRVNARLREALAYLYYQIGMYDQAMELQAEVLAVHREIFGESNIDTIISMNNWGHMLAKRQQFAEAEACFREIHEISRTSLGEDHELTLRSIGSLADSLVHQGKYSEAEKYLRQDLESSRRELGEGHPETILSMNNMGNFLLLTGEYAQAESCLRDALDLSRRCLGEDHRHTLLILNNLNIALQDQGKYEEAEIHVRQCLEATRRALGSEHPDVIPCINNLGMVLLDTGRFKDAEECFRQAIELSLEIFGENSLSTLKCLNNLGVVLQELQSNDEAEVVLQQAVKLAREILDEDDPNVLEPLNNMATLLVNQERHSEAERYLRDAVERSIEILGEGHPSTLTLVNNLGLVLHGQRKLDEAEQYLRKTLDMSRSILGDNDPETVCASTNLGELLAEQGRLAEAEAVFKENVVRGSQVLPSDNSEMFRIFCGLGTAQLGQSK